MKTVTEIKERPLLMAAPVVRALFAGKTQTRRTLRMLCGPRRESYTTLGPCPYCMGYCWQEGASGGCSCELAARIGFFVGQRLWIRETFLVLDPHHWHEPGKPRDKLVTFGGKPAPRRNACAYFADCDGEADSLRAEMGYKWMPSIHMPRWACRCELEVTDVRPQRLQQLTDEDALAEGVVKVRDACYVFRGSDSDAAGICHTSPVTAFAMLWDEINGDGAWESNPWVEAVTFKLIIP